MKLCHKFPTRTSNEIFLLLPSYLHLFAGKIMLQLYSRVRAAVERETDSLSCFWNNIYICKVTVKIFLEWGFVDDIASISVVVLPFASSQWKKRDLICEMDVFCLVMNSPKLIMKMSSKIPHRIFNFVSQTGCGNERNLL